MMSYTKIGIALAIVAAAALFAYSQQTSYEQQFREAVVQQSSFLDEIDLYRKLMAEVGASRAQDILQRTLPDNSKTHMLDHETGAFLYETEGLTGIAACKTYYAGGCYHGFISAVVADRGLGALGDIQTECTNALSSEQVLQCAHGTGHAMLAEVAGYQNLPEALNLCESTFKGDYKRTVNCYDGVFMENNFGAFSVPPPDRWYKASDPMYPCNIPEVLAKPGAHGYCWGMQSQMTLRADAYPQFEGNVVKVGAYCHTLPEKDQFLCLEGLSRQLQLTYSDDTERIAAECAKLGDEAVMCRALAAEAAYIYGSRSAGTLNVCMSIPEAQKRGCYEVLFRGIAISYSATSTRLTACTQDIPEAGYQSACTDWMHTPEGGMHF